MSEIWKTIVESLKGKEHDYTSGSINKALFLLAVPMIIEMLGEGLFAIIDAYFLGKISDAAAATAGIVEMVSTIIYSIAIGVGIAATAMVSRRIGEQKIAEAEDAAVQVVLFSTFLGLVIGVLGWYYAEDILRLMKASDAVIAEGTTYTRILLGTNVVIILLFVLNGIFRGAGDALMSMLSLWVANLLNIILDPLLIFGIGPFPEWGTTGAAVATSIGRGVGVLFQLYILFYGSRVLQLQFKKIRLIPRVMKRVLNIASTGFTQFFIASASWIFISRLINEFGEEVFSGFFFAFRIIIFSILPSWGLANAASTLVGQNLGANKPERAATSVWRAAFYNMLFLVVLSILFSIWAKPLLSIFTQTPAAIESGVLSLRIICVSYIFYAYSMVIGQAFGGAGDTRSPTVVNLICFWALEIPIAYLAVKSYGLGIGGVLWVIAICEALLSITLIFLFRRGKWKLAKV